MEQLFAVKIQNQWKLLKIHKAVLQSSLRQQSCDDQAFVKLCILKQKELLKREFSREWVNCMLSTQSP
jgi:hypothetical protein